MRIILKKSNVPDYLFANFFSCYKRSIAIWSKLFWIILFVFNSTWVNSQEIEITENFIHYTDKDGLSNSIIRSIKQDNYGFMWFATEDGVDRFDGYEFKTYRFENNNPKSLPDNFIFSLCPTSDGGMLVGTNIGGFAKYNVATDDFTVYRSNPDNPNSLSFNKVYALAEDRNGNYWIGTSGGGLNFYNVKTDTFTIYKNKENDPQSLLSDNVSGVLEDNEGNIWVRTVEGLSKLDPKTGKFTNFDLPGNTDNDRMNENMIIDEDGIIWLGWNFQLVKFNTRTMQLEFAKIDDSERQTSEILAVCIHDKNHIWLSTTSGIHLYNKNNYSIQSFYANPENERSLQNDYSNAVFKDRSGVLWCSGLSKLNLNTKKFNHYRFNVVDSESRGGGRIRAVLETSQGNYWVSVINALAIVDPATNKISYTHVNTGNPNAPFNSSPTSFMEDKNQNIWVGLWGSGVTIFEKGNIHKYKKIRPQIGVEGALQDGIIQALYEDSYGNIWFGNEKGVDLYNPETKKFRQIRNDPANENSITRFGVQSNCILEDKYGNFWIGTWGGLTKITLLNPEKGSFQSEYSYKRYLNIPGDSTTISDSRVISIMYDKEKYPNDIFIGTFGGGINIIHFNNETGKDSISTYTTKEGLSNNVVFGILPDDEGNIWMSTNDGISKFNLKTQEFSTYNVDDGLQDNAFYWGGYAKGKNNKLFFGGLNGLNEFIPNQIKNDSIPPEVVFTDFKVLNKTVLPGQVVNKHVILKKPINNTDTIILSYKENVFSFKFSGLHYAFPNDNKYKYKMDGFDVEWIEVDANIRIATYTNLDPGEYTFRVKASNYDGVWNEEGAQIIIIIKPPFWQTWWFRAILLIAIIILLVSFYLIRVKSLKERQEHLEEVVYERTQELQSANHELQEQKEEIQQQSEEILAQRDTLEEQNQMLSISFKRIEMLSDFGQKLTSTLSLTTINDLLYKYVSELIDMSAFGIGIYNEELNHILFSNFIEDGKAVKPFTKDINDSNSLTAYCFNTQEAMYINNVEVEYSNYVQSLNEPATSQTAYSRIHIPLTVQDKKIGVFVVNSYKINAYSPDDFANLKTLASYISIALDNASAYNQINSINRNIAESINYAQSIQSAFLPTRETLDRYFANFVIYKPKETVSGDFYWFSPLEKDESKPRKAIIAVADCTGHGVPGALISIIGNNLLNEIVNIRKINHPPQILEFLNTEFQLALNQDQSQNNDGMDIVLYYIEEISSKSTTEKEFKVLFSGAKNPGIIYRAATKTLEYKKGSRKSIGGVRAKRSLQYYELLEFILQKNDIIYLTTDGFIDQLNKEKNRFSSTRFLEMIENYKDLPLPEQKIKFETELNNHQKKEKQTDDITVVGIRL